MYISITEYYAFEFNVQTEKLKVRIFTIDKDHNVEHYIHNPSVFGDSNLHITSVINYNNSRHYEGAGRQKEC